MNIEIFTQKIKLLHTFNMNSAGSLLPSIGDPGNYTLSISLITFIASPNPQEEFTCVNFTLT